MPHSHLSFAFGVLGNISSFVCFLAPIPTFRRVCKKKSTEGFQSLPYVAALFSAMLWIFYAYMKTGETLLITINAFGCVIETIYLAIYVTFCPKKSKMSTLRMIVLLNFGLFASIVIVTHFLAKGEGRVKLLGWICVVFATSVFAAPLSIIRTVIRTKSVEFLPFPLSLLLLISAVMWLLYGLSLKDIYVTLPNVVGLTFGFIQIALYAKYRKNKPIQDVEKQQQEQLPEQQKGDINVTINENVEKQQPAAAAAAGEIEIGGENNNKNDQKKKEEEQVVVVVVAQEDQKELPNNNNSIDNNNKDVQQENRGGE